MKLAMHCDYCGSPHILADAYAQWSVDAQEWELTDTYPKGDFCPVCDGEARILEVDITNLPPHTALSLAAAWADAEEHGTEPSEMKFSVPVYKPVSDILRAFVEVEATNPAEAKAMAMALHDESEIPDGDFVFWQCGDNTDPVEIGEPEEV
jgi:hypothetical protein